jgi:hypothetical protein
VSQSELLIRVTESLDRLGIAYMVTGSAASSLQGEPRSSHDIDLVVACPEHAAPALCREFPPHEFYLPESMIREAVRRRSMFNLLHIDSGDKVDFWLLTDEPFDTSRFSRRIRDSLFGREMWVSSPEDTILAKLRWSQMSGGSSKQIHDVRGVLNLQGPLLDTDYLQTWIDKLDLRAEWNKLLTPDS